ncbi:MAG: hypothetical protein NDP13_02590 [Crenarchaeota archaeon]|nr:hypothetical protein [Thermoproteota archaeon]MCR8455324.1 hypothetical protein [Thermoproteota archaeon]MCR8501379.1 hypothetical protein [Thermoproteota archaeon]
MEGLEKLKQSATGVQYPSIMSVTKKVLQIDTLPSYWEVRYIILSLGKRRWLRFCSRFSLFNVETAEFVRALSDVLKYLPNLRLEVCAGSGKLSYWLKKFGVDIIATDDYSWKLRRSRFNVEKLSIEEALEKYNPRTVLGSWIPANEKHGESILSFSSVEYFIDIGEGPGADSSWMHAIDPHEIRDFANQFGFNVLFLPISNWAVSQTDEPTPWGITNKTKVILFVKCKEEQKGNNYSAFKF